LGLQEENGVDRGLILDIRRYSVHDGPGIRTTVFFKGCPLSCWWCHNPESQGVTPFVHYDVDRCLRCLACLEVCDAGALFLTDAGVETDSNLCTVCGDCVVACPAHARRMVGGGYSVAEVLAEVEKDRLFYDESGGGVTFSGGEPLVQWRFLLGVLEACGERGIHRTVDTSGMVAPSTLLRVADRTDLFLYDLKSMDPIRHERTTGAPLKPILDNLVRLLQAGLRVWIRLPLIPGFNDDEDNVDRTGAFLAGLGGMERIESVHLLPFHKAAKHKHLKFGMAWRLKGDAQIPPDRTEEVRAHLESHGLTVKIGG